MSTVEVKVPDIGDFKDVPVIDIMVKPGDSVKAEDSLVSLESDKATMDVPAPFAGKVKDIKVKLGDKVSEGSLILTLESGAPAVSAAAEHHKAAVSSPPAPTSAPGGRGRSARARHRRLQGCPRHRSVGEGGGVDTVKGRGCARHAGVGQGDDGCAGAAWRRCARSRGQGGDKVSEGALVADIGHGCGASAAAPAVVAAALRARGRHPRPRLRKPMPRSNESAFAIAYASPGVRKMARDLGVDLGSVKGSGNKGRIGQGRRRSGGRRAEVRPAKSALPPAGGGVGGIDLLPWPKVDFAKFGPGRGRSRFRGSRRSRRRTCIATG
jgi:pyruvate dehydrogenase E2 component (dihydrolipoamide acetyltransferase)